MKIVPTQNFVIVQFKTKKGAAKILLPDGSRNESDDIEVLAVGPDVPKVPPIGPGSMVLLRSDAKIQGIDPQTKTGCVPFTMVMAVLPDEDGVPTDAEINRLADASEATQVQS